MDYYCKPVLINPVVLGSWNPMFFYRLEKENPL